LTLVFFPSRAFDSSASPHARRDRQRKHDQHRKSLQAATDATVM
jgi:hypothetical protein